MFKNIIAPMQAWLLSQGKCVGCGRLLEKKAEKSLPAGRQGLVQVTCVCGRVYMYDTAGGKFRRATLDEIK
ncbi:MAG: hypothetical protein UY48_C0025G0004 [Candidatus Gottesmanbacteria bacterium GW2011_GWB1_49_7]|uniref:Uncharacterized protein n=1 Tax=Candidatus Gottesmanbacteria bacterium GW2011_GWB1_49_7 TaxID=1618448 RepID=A0A0G1VXU4_9BACT|nr:MAG: hypothetical protein UY49_C0035G0010 [Microgenomates group bacterium GW2011_GWC1_49_7]KKW11135.1 MAG: hypothetical protein UY48_C0025G0004 [Candidatus Gottesmanbacteria bacterium GW2011_GWB1_49_7]